MKVKIDVKLLEKQINFCDEFAAVYEKSNDESLKEISEQFEGIANLLSEIRFLAEMGETVQFEVWEEE